MVKLIKYFKWWYYPLIGLIIGLVYIQVDFDLKLVDYMRVIVTLVGQAHQTGVSQSSEILKKRPRHAELFFGINWCYNCCLLYISQNWCKFCKGI